MLEFQWGFNFVKCIEMLWSSWNSSISTSEFSQNSMGVYLVYLAARMWFSGFPQKNLHISVISDHILGPRILHWIYFWALSFGNCNISHPFVFSGPEIPLSTWRWPVPKHETSSSWRPSKLSLRESTVNMSSLLERKGKKHLRAFFAI